MKSPDYTSKPASEHTRTFNGAAATPLDPEDFTRARRGFIASLEQLTNPTTKIGTINKVRIFTMIPRSKRVSPTIDQLRSLVYLCCHK